MVRVRRSPVSHVSLEEQFDRLAAETSGLADRGVLCTDKFPGQALAMLCMTRRRRRCSVSKRGERKEPWLTRKRRQFQHRSSSDAASASSSAAAGSDAASSTSAWHVHASVPAMSKWLALKIVYGTASQNDLERMSKR